MARIRRVAVLVGAAALTGAFVTGPAQADLPEVFSGSAAGTALELSTLGRQATAGHSEAKANSSRTAEARATGMLLPAATVGGTTTGTTTVPSQTVGGYFSDVEAKAGPDQSVTTPRACATPAQLQGVAETLGLGVVCGSARADNGPQPSASAEGSIAELGVSVSKVVTKVEQTLKDAGHNVKVGEQLAGLLGTVCTTAGTENTAAKQPVCDATTTVKTLVETVLKTDVIDVELGKSTSSVTTGPTAVTSEATAAGGTIKILPSPQVSALDNDEPLVTISIGDAKATTVYDRGAGSATADVDPAIVRIKFNSKLVDALPKIPVPDAPDPDKPTKTTTHDVEFPDEIVFGPSDIANLMPLFAGLEDAPVTPIAWCDPEVMDSVCILPGSPLETRVWFAGERKTVNADGSAEAEAHAVRVDLLVGTVDSLDLPDETSKELAKIVSDPAVHLALAHAKAVVGGRRAQTTSTTRTTDGGCTPGTTNCPDDKQEQARSGAPGNGEPPLELPRTGGLPFVPMLGSAGLALAVVLRRAMAQASR